MNTVKHSKDLSLRPLPKRQSRFWTKPTLLAVLLATLLGTYLDLYFVGKEMYRFPVRPWPEIFSINIAFTLVGLPVLVLVFIRNMYQVNIWGKVGLILFFSLLMPIFEKTAEVYGWFVHSEEWKHLYSFFCYMIFLTFIYSFYHWQEKR